MPCDELGVVVVDNPWTTYSHPALVTLAEAGASVVLCGQDHLPTAMIVPLVKHSKVVERLAAQISLSTPMRKRLWQQIVIAKIKAQANNIPLDHSAHKKLKAYAKEVKSGDSTNREGVAAKLYWRSWLESHCGDTLDAERFRRDPTGSGINSFLNYGYAVLRAAIGRGIVSAGLQPSLGLHHTRRDNAFCLADDLIEPFRPLVDFLVREMFCQGYETLDQTAKAELLGVLNVDLQLNGQVSTLPVMVERMLSSLVACYEGESKVLDIPTSIDSEPNSSEKLT